MNQHFTASEFVAEAEKRGWQLKAIIKEVPPKSGRKLLFGFEHSKRSRNYAKKFMLKNPIELAKLHEGPIKSAVQSAPAPAVDDASAGAGATSPAV